MGIYLPNMEMPRKGQMLVIFPDGTSYVCFNGMRERLAQTMAVTVPPHGRLIDADMIDYWSDTVGMGYAFHRDIDELSTIIPADLAEEDNHG